MRRGHRHQVTLDGQTIWVDSDNEEIALRRLIDKYGFAGNWARPPYGIKHVGNYYSTDFELSVMDGAKTSFALLEVKQYRREFTKDRVAAMCVIANHYHTKYLFIYSVITDSWFRIGYKNRVVEPCPPPKPGALKLADIRRPRTFITKNYYGRKYNQSFSDKFFSLFR